MLTWIKSFLQPPWHDKPPISIMTIRKPLIKAVLSTRIAVLTLLASFTTATRADENEPAWTIL